jgi:hypothetical protein
MSFFVNCGEDRSRDGLKLEACSPEISGHGDNILNCYISNHIAPKIEISYSGKDTYEVYFFKFENSSQHYRSYQYKLIEGPYASLAKELAQLYSSIDFHKGGMI